MSQAQYKLIYTSLGLEHLEECVNELVANGFVPVGGVTATSFNYGQPSAYAQAMFKEAE